MSVERSPRATLQLMLQRGNRRGECAIVKESSVCGTECKWDRLCPLELIKCETCWFGYICIVLTEPLLVTLLSK